MKIINYKDIVSFAQLFNDGTIFITHDELIAKLKKLDLELKCVELSSSTISFKLFDDAIPTRFGIFSSKFSANYRVLKDKIKFTRPFIEFSKNQGIDTVLHFDDNTVYKRALLENTQVIEAKDFLDGIDEVLLFLEELIREHHHKIKPYQTFVFDHWHKYGRIEFHYDTVDEIKDSSFRYLANHISHMIQAQLKDPLFKPFRGKIKFKLSDRLIIHLNANKPTAKGVPEYASCIASESLEADIYCSKYHITTQMKDRNIPDETHLDVRELVKDEEGTWQIETIGNYQHPLEPERLKEEFAPMEEVLLNIVNALRTLEFNYLLPSSRDKHCFEFTF